jgi:hypothetical protein
MGWGSSLIDGFKEELKKREMSKKNTRLGLITLQDLI